MKISRTKLIEAVKADIANQEATYEKEKQEYLASFENTRDAIIAALKEAVKAAQSAKEYAHLQFLSGDRYSQNVSVAIPSVKMPYKPQPPSQLEYSKRDLKMLEMSSEENIAVREYDRFMRYL